jgi:uroporphyrinogen decarboxylase
LAERLVDSCIDAGVDIITLSDDWGSNNNMLFSPRMWRRMIAPYAARVVKRARDRGVPVNLHSDGYILNIMDELVEMGYSMMHPVQESAGMDPQHIKEKYGDKLVVYGSLDVVDSFTSTRAKRWTTTLPNVLRFTRPGSFIFQYRPLCPAGCSRERLIHAYTANDELALRYGA